MTTGKDKIRSLGEIAAIINLEKKAGKRVVLCHGVFDLLHPGHIKHFEGAKEQGDVLAVSITPDRFVNKGPGRPIFNERLRCEAIAGLEAVDYVFVNEWPISVETIKLIKPDIYCKGSDYKNVEQDLTGKITDEREAIESVGGKIHFTDDIVFSSTKIINSHFSVFSEDADAFLQDFRSRYSQKDIIEMLKSLADMKVLVIGDTIIDEYHYCTPLGKSAKDLLIPAHFVYEEKFAGGILAIANHISGFCNRVDIITCLGADHSHKDFIAEHLKPNISAKFFSKRNAPTTVKRRFVEADILRKMFEVYIMDGHTSVDSLSDEMCVYLEKVIGEYDLVLVGDYGHSMIDQRMIDVLCAKSKFLAVNVQTNSANIGFNLITKYQRADYICIDEPEIRLATHNNQGNVRELAKSIIKRLSCGQAVVTRGHLGSLVYGNGDGFVDVPVFSREVVDRVGAGDAYLAITSPCAAKGLPKDVIGFIGNAAGALAIRIVGNRSPVEPLALYRYISTLLK